MPSKNKLAAILIIFSAVILIAPILVIHVTFLKDLVFWLFKNKTNAYEYLQFSGAFLGVIGAVGGAYLLTDKGKKL